MRSLNIILTLLILLLFSCDKFEYSHYEVDPVEEYNNINQNNIDRFISNSKDTTIIAVIGDSQRFYDSTNDVIKNINSFPEIDFVIHTGDLVDFGLQREYTWMHELLCDINSPYVAVIGNHDLIGNGGTIYNYMYGPFNFSFIYNGNKYIYLNTNGREFDFEGDVPNISWLNNELSDTTNYNQAIIVNHIAPTNIDFDVDLEEEYVSTLQKYGKVILSINGHNHDYAFSQPYNDGISYLNSHSTSKEKFVLLKIWDNNFSIETIKNEDDED